MADNPNAMSHKKFPGETKNRLGDKSEFELLRAFFDNFPEGLCIESDDGSFIYANDAAACMHGYTREELLKITPFDLMSNETKYKLPDLQQREVLNGSVSLSIKTVKKNGDLLPVDMITKLIPFGNKMIRLIRIKGKPELAEETIMSEETMKSFRDYLPEIMGEPEMVIEVDVKGIVKSASKSFFDISGFVKNDIRKKMPIEKLILPELREKIGDVLKKALSGETPELQEFVFVKKNGTIFPILSYGIRIESEGTIHGVRIFIIDITDHKVIENKLIEMEKFHALGEVSGGVMHDIKNICTIILGYIELMMLKDTGSELCNSCRGILDKMKKAAMDGAFILKRAQNFGNSVDEKETELIDLNDLINDVVDMYRHKWEAETHSRGLKIFIVKDLAPLPRLNANPSELREVFGNIILNAIDATITDGVITIKSEFISNEIKISVSDSGVGIPKKETNKIFEPFYTTKGTKGTGLGLFVTKNIIQKLGGSIDVESVVDEGSTFMISLPLSVPDFRPQQDLVSISSDGERILVIDDEKNICDILSEFLTIAGYKVKAVQSGAAGLELLDSDYFDAVITDLNMPGMSGLDVARNIKNRNPVMKIIMLTGWGTGIHELNNREMLVDSILHKPVSFNKLISSVKEAFVDRKQR